MDVVYYIITFVVGCGCGWLAHVLYKHNPEHIAEAQKKADDLYKKVKG